MSPALPTTPPSGGQYRQAIIDAAIELTATTGWATVTMGKLAERVGVSRQTVYNDLGSKAALAEAMLSDELARFLAVVHGAFDRHPTDVVEAIYDAIRSVLEIAHDDTLLRAIVTATHGTETELLPLLTTRADTLITEASTTLVQRIGHYQPSLSDDQLTVVTDMVVRTVLSHIMQPSGTPEATADGLAWLAARALNTTSTPSLRRAQ